MDEDVLLELIARAAHEGRTHFSLFGKEIRKLPAEIGQLQNLQSLSLAGNKLTTVPPEIGQLQNLQRLDISSNQLTAVPPEIVHLRNLKSLDISGNQLAIVPPEIGRLRKLRVLKLHANSLAELPKSIGDLKKLQSLNLMGNNIQVLPDSIRELKDLQYLNLRNNKLNFLPDLSLLRKLQSLDISQNKIQKTPDWLINFLDRKKVFMDDNPLVDLSPLATLSSEKLDSVATLQDSKDYSDLQFSSNDPQESSRDKKQIVITSSFDKQTIHDSQEQVLLQIERIRRYGRITLNLRNRGMTDLPPEIGQLQNLEELDISQNKLTNLPIEIGLLQNLQFLDLRNNQLTIVPSEIIHLHNLKSLDISQNKIQVLPEWLISLPRLEELFLEGNPIIIPSPELLGDTLTWNGYSNRQNIDLNALRRYYIQLKNEGDAYFYEAKLLIIGEARAGKTSLARKLQDPTISLPDEEDSTEGIWVGTWDFPLPKATHIPYHTYIWDFGGQEIYFATHQFFLTRRSTYILVTDTRQQHTDFYTWLLMQETFGDNSPVILLKNRNRQKGNKFTIENLPQLRERFPNLKEIIELDLNEAPYEVAWETFLQEGLFRFDEFW